jgi:hypothetical protein
MLPVPVVQKIHKTTRKTVTVTETTEVREYTIPGAALGTASFAPPPPPPKRRRTTTVREAGDSGDSHINRTCIVARAEEVDCDSAKKAFAGKAHQIHLSI